MDGVSQGGQGGQVGQVVGMLGSSSQHNVLSENKRVYMFFSSSIKENVRYHACDRLMGRSGWSAHYKCS